MIRRSRVRLGLLVALTGAVLLTLLVGSSAALPAGCSFDANSGTTSCVFASTGAEQTFTVPAGVTSVHVVALGAAGGGGEDSGGGRGAVVSGDLSVSPAELLYVEVGGTPTVSGSCVGGAVCVGGFNGGGSSHFGGGGGGASDVRTTARADTGTLASRLLVAAGGGGGGEALFCGGASGGGDAGASGADGANCGTAGGTGGGPGAANTPGAGGSPDGGSGDLGIGGGGGLDTGGGGGGGRYGGGGGGDITFDGGGGFGDAGGGGGGSNLVPAGGTPGLTSDPAQITISYANVTDQLASLFAEVNGLTPESSRLSLLKKLDKIQIHLDANDIDHLCKKDLKAFIKQVGKELKKKKITGDEAESLITQAHNILDTLGC